eukprot:364872-Chlamydomonas_euryale.AAC.3
MRKAVQERTKRAKRCKSAQNAPSGTRAHKTRKAVQERTKRAKRYKSAKTVLRPLSERPALVGS